MRKSSGGIRANGRFAFILFAFFAAFALMFGRVLYMKVVHGAEYEAAAKNQQINRYDITIPPNRGSILDRNNQVLAISTTVYNVALDSLQLAEVAELSPEEQEKTLTTLCEYFPELDYNTLKQYVTINPETGELYMNNHWKYLVKGIERSVKEELEAMNLKGVYFEKSSKRSYPLNSSACHLVGFTRGDAQWGLEGYYNSYMEGTPGRSFILYNGADSVVHQDYDAKDGDTIITTIDYNIQKIAEEVVAETAAEWPAKNVAAMVMDPYTGEIYAMAESHSFDLNNPNEIPEWETDTKYTENWDQLSSEEQLEYLNTMWKNFCVSDTYEPGSIFKPMLVAAALEEGVITPNSSFQCNGYTDIGGYRIKCHLVSGHGNINVEQIMAQSCNMGVIQIANLLGADKFYEYQREFGFGDYTGIDLPGEAAGQLHSKESIGPTELATMSFGQTFNCTSIQVIAAFSSLINGGNLVKPHVVSQIVDADGNVVLENDTEVVRRVISEKTSAYMRTALKATVENGLAKKLQIDGYSIGCKTGTAEQGSRTNDDLWALSNMSYFPAENPKYIVFTVINQPSDYVEGVQTPTPMTKKLIEGIIKYDNLEPTQPVEDEANLSQNKTVTVADYTDSVIFDVIGDLDGKELTYKVVGNGNTVVNQVPKGGTTVDVGSEVILYVQRSEEDTGTVSVPNVVGKNYEQAETTLTNAGFTVAFEGDQSGTVTAQDPKYGVSVAKGSEVMLTLEIPEKTDTSTDTTGTQTTQ
ncbi:penicillin-binding transpeptidase domain-containing protein [Anaerotignum lactatifermentans]|uniref:Stage V sporulation protein D (Sporulation-specific penicillin-binding protein) n=1 Tax=Anaerotignum lactatifermentans DSM 14214 TaxID=1121323 RepID=A0A1M6PY12_9FIRM|nr:penicillin-binding transpeptidase domain-containing protein [Anaerotignum lactatifermentans]SHK12829.1 stage V sporulation protein D (sporulation-specific penicillin-binding protein) [[Clostridium] lactatifermentans DSM 14214] [Anaerotignum lactatifermentans DSM 14214]